MIHGLIAPHGGELVINMASEWERAELRERAGSLPQVRLGSRQLADLEMLANGAHSPLGGFMSRADYLAVVNEMHLSNGLPWSIPITLAVSTEQAATCTRSSGIPKATIFRRMCACAAMKYCWSITTRLIA